MVGVCATNAMVGMLGFGSEQPLLGNNPLAIGVPRSANRDPVVLDIAMSQAAVGRFGHTGVRDEARRLIGALTAPESLPAIRPPLSPRASTLPMGGHKGAGLALMIEMLTGALTGGILCYEMAEKDPTGTDAFGSKSFFALDPRAVGDADEIEQRVEDLLAYLQSAAKPGMAILYPGQRGCQELNANLCVGFPSTPILSSS